MREYIRRGNSQRRGKVFLVGAGPGDPELITVRGAACLRQADVAVYDYLVSTELLEYLPPRAERVFAGKLAGNHFLNQDEITELLIRKAQEGKQVVRLKGGDPFVFGRGGEECLALSKAGVPFEVVPGISAATGASVYAGIPVTQRGYASSLYMVTAHLSSKGAELNINWERLAGVADTLCIYMGMRILPEIAQQLQLHGCASDTPVAVIQWGTHAKQRTVIGNLGDIVEKVNARGLGRPGLIIVGEVVRLRDRLNWFERRPLFGRRVVIARLFEGAEEWMFRLRELGAEVIPLPVVETVPPDTWDDLDRAIDSIRDYGAIVFTSPSAVRFVLGRLEELGLDARRLGGVRLCAVGASTVRALDGYHLRPDLTIEEATANSIAEIDELKAMRLLVPCSNLATAPRQALRQQFGPGADAVTACQVIPRSRGADTQREPLNERPIDWAVFPFPSAVNELLDYLRPILGVDALHEIGLASLDSITSDRIREYGLEPTVEGVGRSVSALLDKILDYELRFTIEAGRDECDRSEHYHEESSLI